MQTKAKKSLGQNWLVNPHIVDKIISAAEITKDDVILEVGPGTGNLTKKLVEKSKKVFAVEKDSRLIELLEKEFKNQTDLKVIEDDILKFRVTDYVQEGRYKVVANIPYYVTSAFLRTVLEKWPKPELIVLTIQKEVAQRIIAKPPHMNLLALPVQYYAEPKIISYISKNNFRPVPKVDSAVIKLVPKSKIKNQEYEKQLFELMHMGFSEKRKQLASVLSKKIKLDKDEIGKHLVDVGLKEASRPESLSLEQWESLSRALFRELK